MASQSRRLSASQIARTRRTLSSGAVWVAEAGRGGSGPCITGPDDNQLCAGATGALTKISHGEQKRVLSGLPSIADPAIGGGDALGPHDVALTHAGGVYFVVGLGANPAVREQLGELGPAFGHLYKLWFGHVREIADIAGFEATENPDGSLPDSNAFSVVTHRGRTAVVDAGGNSLLRVRHSGSISTLAVFPPRLVPAPPGIPDLP
ncbi:MAG: ScyD/ScyE family protein, partial [Pseudonocardiaceae bacterium]